MRHREDKSFFLSNKNKKCTHSARKNKTIIIAGITGYKNYTQREKCCFEPGNKTTIKSCFLRLNVVFIELKKKNYNHKERNHKTIRNTKKALNPQRLAFIPTT